jgi:hypothetical protein
MFRRQKHYRTFSSEPETHQDDNFSKQNVSFTYIIPSKTKNNIRYSRSPGYSSFHSFRSHKNPTQLKLVPKKITSDSEQLSEENLALKAISYSLSKENLSLRTKLSEMVHEVELESHEIVQNMKNKARKLNYNIINLDRQILSLKAASRTSKMPEIENKIQIYTNEAIRLRDHIEKMINYEGESDQHERQKTYSAMAGELQALKLENKRIKAYASEVFHELDVYKGKFKSLDDSKTLKKIKDKIEKSKTTKGELSKELNELKNDFKSRMKTVDDKVSLQREDYRKKVADLEDIQLRIKKQDEFISEMKKNNEKLRIASKARRGLTFMPSTLRQEIIMKLINPPRLMVKINSLLKRKKMIVTVFLSLLDKNNNGLMHITAFTAAMKTYGLNIKDKHIKEIEKLLGINIVYVPLRKLEDLYDKYRYEGDYKSSSDDDQSPNARLRKISNKSTEIANNGNSIKGEIVEPVIIEKAIEKEITVANVDEIKDTIRKEGQISANIESFPIATNDIDASSPIIEKKTVKEPSSSYSSFISEYNMGDSPEGSPIKNEDPSNNISEVSPPESSPINLKSSIIESLHSLKSESSSYYANDTFENEAVTNELLDSPKNPATKIQEESI